MSGETQDPDWAAKPRPPTELGGGLRATFFCTKHALLVRAEGEIDLTTEAQFREALLEALLSADRVLELDLAGVSFIGARGLQLLDGAAEGAARMGICFRIVRASQVLRRAVGLAGLDDLLF